MEIKEKELLKDYELIEEYKKGNNEALVYIINEIQKLYF